MSLMTVTHGIKRTGNPTIFRMMLSPMRWLKRFSSGGDANTPPDDYTPRCPKRRRTNAANGSPDDLIIGVLRHIARFSDFRKNSRCSAHMWISTDVGQTILSLHLKIGWCNQIEVGIRSGNRDLDLTASVVLYDTSIDDGTLTNFKIASDDVTVVTTPESSEMLPSLRGEIIGYLAHDLRIAHNVQLSFTGEVDEVNDVKLLNEDVSASARALLKDFTPQLRSWNLEVSSSVVSEKFVDMSPRAPVPTTETLVELKIVGINGGGEDDAVYADTFDVLVLNTARHLANKYQLNYRHSFQLFRELAGENDCEIVASESKLDRASKFRVVVQEVEPLLRKQRHRVIPDTLLLTLGEFSGLFRSLEAGVPKPLCDLISVVSTRKELLKLREVPELITVDNQPYVERRGGIQVTRCWWYYLTWLDLYNSAVFLGSTMEFAGCDVWAMFELIDGHHVAVGHLHLGSPNQVLVLSTTLCYRVNYSLTTDPVIVQYPFKGRLTELSLFRALASPTRRYRSTANVTTFGEYISQSTDLLGNSNMMRDSLMLLYKTGVVTSKLVFTIVHRSNDGSTLLDDMVTTTTNTTTTTTPLHRRASRMPAEASTHDAIARIMREMKGEIKPGSFAIDDIYPGSPDESASARTSSTGYSS
jgi:hypothetical protein